MSKLRNSALLKIRIIAYTLILTSGLLRDWVGRYSISPDGICYLDLGDAFFHRKWFDAINALWSPLYACLLGAVMYVARPSARMEFPLSHVVNFAIYLLSLLCFEYFLRSLVNTNKDQRSQSPETRQQLYYVLAHTGAKAVIAEGIPADADDHWQQLGTTSFFVRALPTSR